MKIGRDWQTQRRLRALALHRSGWQQKTIAQALGVTKGAVSQWLKKVKDLPDEKQTDALVVKRSTGRKPALTADDRRRLAALVDRGAESFGFVGDVWTAARVRSVARKELGLMVGLTTIKKFLHAEGFSAQKPEVVATQKNEKAVAGFRGETGFRCGGWHRLKKGPNEQVPP